MSLTEWRAWGPVQPEALARVRFVAGCFSSEVSTWVDEADEIALDKLAQIAASTALRVTNVGALARTDRTKDKLVTVDRLSGTGEGSGALSAATLLGFEGGLAHGCFALCADPQQTCKDSVLTARLEGPLSPPPPPNAGARALVTLVHHPAAAGWGLVGLFVGACAIAVATRKRPR